MAELVTVDSQIEQYIIDLLKVNSAIVTAGSAVKHLQDNDAQKADNFVIAAASGTAPIYTGLPYKKTALQIICGTRVIGCDESGSKRDNTYSAAQSVLSGVAKGDKSAYGFAVDGVIIREASDGKDETHIFKIVNADIFFRDITIVTTTTTTAATTTTTTTTTH
jgi:hypothetical protein